MALSKKNRSRLWSALILLLLLLFGLESACRTYGLPVFCRELLQERLAQSGLNSKITWVKASLFSGITLNGVLIKADTPLGPLCLQAREVHTGLNLIELFRQRFPLDNCKATGIRLLLLTHSGQNTYQCEQMSFQARRQGGSSWSANLFFSLQGIRLRGELQLENCPDPAEFCASLTDGSGGWSAEQLKQIRKALESAARILPQCEFGSNDANISFSAACDALDLAATTVHGDFDLNYSRIGEILVTKQRGQFRYAGQKLHFENLHWLLNNDERLMADAVLNFAARTVAAKFQGRLRPDTVLSLVNPWGAVWPDFLSCPLPIDFQGQLPETGWDLSQAEPSLQGSVASLTLFGSTLPQTSFNLQLQNQNIILSDLLLSFDYHQNRFVRGNLNWNYQRRRLSGDLSAQLNLAALLKNYGLSDSQTVLTFADWDDVRLTIRLQESPLSWQGLRLQGHLQEQYWRGFNYTVYALSLPFTLADGILSIDNASAGIDNPLHDNIDCSVRIDLEAALASRVLRPAFELALRPHPEDVVAPGRLSGECEIDCPRGTLAISNAQGSLLPERLLTEFPRLRKIIPLQLDSLLSCPQPLQLQFAVPAFTWDKPQTGRLLLHCRGNGISFNGLDIHAVSADAEITLEETRFQNIRGLINDDEMVSLDLLLKHDPPLLNISNALIQGKPDFIEAFIFSPFAVTVYQSIWEDVSWSPTRQPTIYIPSMIYYEDPLNDNNWILQLDCDLAITDAAYKSFPVPQADISLQLQLPHELIIAPIVLSTANGDIKARVNCTFSEVPHCEFFVDETECSPDTILLLQSINDDWKDFLTNFTLHEQAKIRCQGAVSFVSPPEIKLSGSLTAPECTYRNFRLREVSASWKYSDDQLFWDVSEAEFLSAAVQTTGHYDFRAQSGETLLKIRDLPLQEANALLFPAFNGGQADSLSGRLNSDCKLKLLHHWAGMPLYLEGDGHLKLREADLWRVPLLGSLSSILALGTMNIFAGNSTASLGTISELTADFNFKGTRVVVPSFETNGTFVSLSGSGEYSWLTDELRFLVQGHALRNVNILSFMLKPLSWAFDAELQGTSKKPEWKIRNPFSRVFSTD